MHPVDYSNLANIAALVKVSPGLPLDATAGLQPLGYHWFFFALPAWASEVLGGDARVAEMLVVFNALSAVLLIATVAVVLPKVSKTAAAIAIAVSLFAPFSLYAYQVVLKLLHVSIGERNALLLSPVNSMTTFGNNTLAIVLALLTCRLIEAWNERPHLIVAALAGLLSAALAGYSVTLAMPLALAWAAWLLMRRIRSPIKFIVTALPLAIVGGWILTRTQVLGSGAERPAISFDQLQFLRNVVFGMAPVVALSVIGWSKDRRLSIYEILMLACVAVPTFVALAGSRSGESALSMKIATLLAVSATPLVAGGAQVLLARWKEARSRIVVVLVGVVVCVGTVNTAAYVLQFAAARVLHRGSRFVEIPRDYFEAMLILRSATPRHALVIDPFHAALPDTISTLLLAERRVWLETKYSAEVHQLAADDLIATRATAFENWRRGRYEDKSAATYLAATADALLLDDSDGVPPAPWKLYARHGGYSVYLSQLEAR